MSAFDEMAAARVTMQDQIDDLTARLNTEHLERIAADDHTRHATEEAVELLRGAAESLDCLSAVKEAVRVLQALNQSLERKLEVCEERTQEIQTGLLSITAKVAALEGRERVRHPEPW